MIEGTVVYLNSSQGKIKRVLVKDMGGILLVCRKEEWRRANESEELPVSVGFKRTDLVENENCEVH